MKMFLAYLLVLVAVAMAGYHALASYADLPVVHQSYLTKDCVRVLLADGSEGDCADLPDKYHHVWVQ